MAEIVPFPVVRVESFGLWEQERRAERVALGFPPPDDEPLGRQNPGPIVIGAVRDAARRVRRSLIGDDVA